MTNLQKTEKIYENVMKEKLPYQVELYLRKHCIKEHQTIETLLMINEDALINSYLYDTEDLYGTLDPEFPNMSIYERAKMYARLDMNRLNEFRERTKWNS